ncbi:lactose permease [Hyaloscypha hepaticicola]|uniref:Lactose permease n=1 Tax=Hyaloscypha hepaticicola TaxID=2082293 RepID=A0A2J6PQH9_9HELO|nr:lactose permease [Hyaloscypha hepaticicola]
MSKEQETPEISEASPDFSHYPIVAAGSGKTAANEGAQAKTVYNAELFAALQETHINYRSKESIHLYFAVLVAFACACANGYDGSLIGSISAMTYFKKTFGTSLTGIKLAGISSLYNVGSIVTSPVGAIISDKYGRRVGMFCGAWVIILGSVIAASSHVMAQLVVGRFILGAGIQIMTVAAPAYAVEISPPHWRGRCVGFYNNGWFGGSIPAALITFGTNNINSDWSWRIPVILQCFACIFVICAVWFIPESPRYYMANGRQEQALAFLVKYHGNGDANSRLVRLEIEEMREGIKQDGLDKTWWDYRPLFSTHHGRWRMAQVLMISIFGQFSGNGLGYYNAAIFNNMGITTTAGQLGYNILATSLQAIGGMTGMSLTDKMPRRKVLVIGTFLCACLLACNAGLTSAMKFDNSFTPPKITNLPYAKGALAFYFLFQVFYGFTYTPLQGVIPAEALDTNRRAKGLAASGFIVGCMGFINTFCTPIATGNIGYKYIWIFVGWDVIESILWYLFCVESQGRSLEELEYIYDQKSPVKASLHVDKVVVQADGRVSEKVVDDI